MVNCERCKKQFIDEEFNDHDCSPTATKAQEIGIDYLLDGELNENGDLEYIAKGLNGILYRLVECPHNPTHTNLDQTTFDNLETKRRFDRTS
ncbi:MAG: hypothetical protein KGI28_01530 [Thaumarchaeota archaeon]|nr:hypothetical protein [Nitrososphaerota archaeon]